MEQLDNEEIAFIIATHLDTQLRIYDCLLTLVAAQAGPETAKSLQELHEQGDYLYPPPFKTIIKEDPE